MTEQEKRNCGGWGATAGKGREESVLRRYSEAGKGVLLILDKRYECVRVLEKDRKNRGRKKDGKGHWVKSKPC